ncbi:unnamed protein product [Effrenium voratum]|uniref:PCI domain-containing protein n=1 Tax=Effrenium voratum TaxID=2562239 RepID=A0AA36J5C1_9DINO|nr:unnamed protein product [Effrenium voratum]CAJ1399389.1 unnamed protein product [Effrenium voratum]
MDTEPLSQFVILAQNAQGRACEALVRQALDHAGVFVFGELLECANVQALQGTEFQPALELLRLFAFGSYPDYKARQGDFGELTAAQLRKLQMLTLVSMATKDKVIRFSDLEAAVDVTGTRALEDLIIEAVYQNLVVGKMDQENNCLIVDSVACRDCRAEDIDYIIETLTAWQASAQDMIRSLDASVSFAVASNEKQKAAQEELEKEVKLIRETLKEGDSTKAGGGGCTRMQTEDADEESKRAKSTRGRWVGGMSKH